MNLLKVTDEQLQDAKKKLVRSREYFLNEDDEQKRIASLTATVRQVMAAAKMSEEIVDVSVLDHVISIGLNYLLIEIHKKQKADESRGQYRIRLISLLVTKAPRTNLDLTEFDATELDSLSAVDLKEAINWLEHIDKPDVMSSIVPEFLKKYQR